MRCTLGSVRRASMLSRPPLALPAFPLQEHLTGSLDHATEQAVYHYWAQAGLYTNRQDGRRPYTVLTPPLVPNGRLHLGDAVTLYAKDAMERFARMNNSNVQHMQVLDDSGIESLYYARKAAKKRLLQKARFGADKVPTLNAKISITNSQKINHLWTKYCFAKINEQLKGIGVTSYDHSLEQIRTTSPQNVNEVLAMFRLLFQQNLVYKARRSVYWSPLHQSILDDSEVYHQRLDGPKSIKVFGAKDPVQFGQWYSIQLLVKPPAYKKMHSSRHLEIFTDRPEILFGLEAIAVDPQKDTLSKYAGFECHHPLLKDKVIPIIADYDSSFDQITGVQGIFPAHDRSHLPFALKHNLIICPVIDNNGRMTRCGPDFDTLGRFDVRRIVIESLQKQEVLRPMFSEHFKSYLPRCSITGDVLEPLVGEYWFFKSSQFLEKLRSAIKDETLLVSPPPMKTLLFDSLEGSADVCISKQNVNGIRIPMYKVVHGSNSFWIFANSHFEAQQIVVNSQNLSLTEFSIYRECDVLCSNFVSALLVVCKPTQGNIDIICGSKFVRTWLNQVLMMALWKSPDNLMIERVYIHKMPTDSDGNAITRLRGNVVDPLSLIRIDPGIPNSDFLKDFVYQCFLNPKKVDSALKTVRKDFPISGLAKEWGMEPRGRMSADCIRYGIMSILDPQVPVQLSMFAILDSEAELSQTLFQISTFLLGHKRSKEEINFLNSSTMMFDDNELDWKSLGDFDRWILVETRNAMQKILAAFKCLNLHIVTRTLSQLVSEKINENYLSFIKVSSKDNNEVKDIQYFVLRKVFLCALKSLHPLMPFTTEVLYQRTLRNVEVLHSDTLAWVPYPTPESVVDIASIPSNLTSTSNCETFFKAISRFKKLFPQEGRSQIQPSLVFTSVTAEMFMKNHTHLFCELAGCSSLKLIRVAPLGNKSMQVNSKCIFTFPPDSEPELFDPDELTDSIEVLRNQYHRELGNFSDDSFLSSSPEATKVQVVERLMKIRAKIKRLHELKRDMEEVVLEKRQKIREFEERKKHLAENHKRMRAQLKGIPQQ